MIIDTTTIIIIKKAAKLDDFGDADEDNGKYCAVDVGKNDRIYVIDDGIFVEVEGKIRETMQFNINTR